MEQSSYNLIQKKVDKILDGMQDRKNAAKEDETGIFLEKSGKMQKNTFWCKKSS